MSKGGISYDRALEMDDGERLGVLIALRGQFGWTYLGKGHWQKPQWLIEQERMAKEAQNGK